MLYERYFIGTHNSPGGRSTCIDKETHKENLHDFPTVTQWWWVEPGPEHHGLTQDPALNHCLADSSRKAEGNKEHDLQEGCGQKLCDECVTTEEAEEAESGRRKVESKVKMVSKTRVWPAVSQIPRGGQAK